MSLSVTEIFYSIQGESLHAGRPCVFIRLSGCNLRCHYCATQYAFSPGNPMTIAAIQSQIKVYNCNLVEITGGEPLLQSTTPILIQTLLDSGYEVLLETNGSLDVNRVDSRCCRIMDLKCPSSGESDQNDLLNFKRLTTIDQLKCVIADRSDYLFAKAHLSELPSGFPMAQVLFSPITAQLPAAKLADWILMDQLGVRLQLQLHKIIWPSIERGV